ncbi:cobalamin biosynthesis protein CobG [Streptomyces sp. NPDC126499]|uniref:cobalamin biosynthesis protein CobG n=1 Tax=Streptomyces sp. NPDC126499 TaxID=3155314 RepID=UPI00332EB5BD
MPPTPPSTPEPGEARIRDRGDACPGALRLHPADDGRLARLRLPGGRLTVRQAEALALAAETLGDGRISITSRGNAELRGLADDCGTRLAALLDDAGLLPSPSHERVRNIVASPAAGLDGLGPGAAQLWARALDTLLCAEPWTAALSGRFLFVLDDGHGDVAGLGGDVTLIAVGAGGALPRDGGQGFRGAGEDLLHAGGQDFWVAGEDAARAARAGAEAGGALLHAGGQGFWVAGEDAARAALAGAEAFLAAAEAAGNGAWRVRELPPGTALDVAGALARAGIAGEPVPDASLPQGEPPAPGVLGANGLYVLAPLGRLTAAQLRALAAGAEELRFTPWRGVVVVEAAPGDADTRAEAGLTPWRGRVVVEATPRDADAQAETGMGLQAPREGHGPEQPTLTPGGPGPAPADHRPADARDGHGPERPAGPPGGTAPSAATPVPVPGAGHGPEQPAPIPTHVTVTVTGDATPHARLRRLAALGLVTSPAAPLAGVSACTGRPGCGKALADVRADAGRAPGGGLPVHYSGCERRCGHPHGAWVDVLAVGDGDYLVDGAPIPRTSLTEAVATARTTR